jgi:iron(III) transport system ATP-binding protein
VSALSIRGVTKAFGSTKVLAGVDLDVPANSLTAILGPSGCGKTTLLRLVAGFDDPDAGLIAFDGEPVFGNGRSTPAQRRRVGYVPQEGALFPHLDVDANITFGLPRAARRRRQRVEELLELVDLDPEVRRRYPHELSGGQQQRVALARALAPNPAIVLLDEPFASLDAALREGTGRAVAQALHTAGATGVLVTHDQGEALSLADQVAIMRDGRLVQIGTPDDVYATPVDTGVGEFVGAAVVLPAVVTGDRAECALGTLHVRPGGAEGPVRALIRPEQVELRQGPAGEGVPAQVTEISFFGHDAAVRLELLEAGAGTPQILARVLSYDVPELGSTVRLAVRGDIPVYRPACVDLTPAAAPRAAPSPALTDSPRMHDRAGTSGPVLAPDA